METTIFHNIIYGGLYGVRLGDAATAQRQGGRITPEPEKTWDLQDLAHLRRRQRPHSRTLCKPLCIIQ